VKNKRLIDLFIVLILFSAYVYFIPRWGDWSQNTRLDLTMAIVDKGTLSIDEYYSNTGDYAYFNGRYYADKAPGPSLLGVPIYFVVRPIIQSPVATQIINRLTTSAAFQDTLRAGGTGLLFDKVYFLLVLFIVTFITNTLPTILLALLLYRYLFHIGVPIQWSVAVTLIYGLATSAFPYAGGFYSHQLCAMLLFGAFYIGFCLQRGILQDKVPFWLLVAGFMLGYAVISEYPTSLIAGGVFVYILLFILKNLRKPAWITFFILGGFVPGLILMAYNLAIFHTPLPVGYEYSVLYTEQHSVGLISLTYPHPDALWGITFGSFRGIFYVSPITLLALVGTFFGWKQKNFRAEWMVSTWTVVSFFLFNASSVMWQGGFAVGPRYLVPMIPFLMIGLGYLAILYGERKIAIALVSVLTAWSFVVIWAETIGGQSFPDWTQNPLFNYSLPKLLSNDIARNFGMAIGLHGWISLLPLLLVEVILFIGLVLSIKRAWAKNLQPVDSSRLAQVSKAS
jgi:hypothetical protein